MQSPSNPSSRRSTPPRRCKLAEVRGVVLLAAAQAQIPAHSYSPREVKANVTGYGGASKQQVQQMVKSLLGLDRCPEPADAADALAVALCHAQMSRARERLAASTTLRRRTVSSNTGSRAPPGFRFLRQDDSRRVQLEFTFALESASNPGLILSRPE